MCYCHYHLLQLDYLFSVHTIVDTTIDIFLTHNRCHNHKQRRFGVVENWETGPFSVDEPALVPYTLTQSFPPLYWSLQTMSFGSIIHIYRQCTRNTYVRRLCRTMEYRSRKGNWGIALLQQLAGVSILHFRVEHHDKEDRDPRVTTLLLE